MRDRMERLILLPFSAGCISESSIPVVMQHTRKSKLDIATPTRTREEETKDNEEEGCLDDEGHSLPRFQKLFKNIKNLSQLFVYKDELEPEMRVEIGLPTDVKHVTHIGIDGSASSIWNNLAEPELINLHSFSLTQHQLAIKSQAATSLLQTKCTIHDNTIAQ